MKLSESFNILALREGLEPSAKKPAHKQYEQLLKTIDASQSSANNYNYHIIYIQSEAHLYLAGMLLKAARTYMKEMKLAVVFSPEMYDRYGVEFYCRMVNAVVD